jgi:hypothetical protein
MYSVTAGFLHSGAGQAHSLFGMTILCQSILKVLTLQLYRLHLLKNIPRPMVKLPSNDRNFLSVIFMEATPFVFITKQTTLIHSHTAQVNFNSFGYLHMLQHTKSHKNSNTNSYYCTQGANRIKVFIYTLLKLCRSYTCIFYVLTLN